MGKFLLSVAALFFTASAFAQRYEYKCFSYYWNGYDNEKGTMTLVVHDSKNATADIDKESWDRTLGGKLNPSYKSKGSIKYLKFGGQLILEEVLVEGGKTLNDGKLGGFARVEGQAEGGFYQYKFICKR